MSRTKTFLLIDAYGQIFRAYYAIRQLTNSKGMPTNAVYGFTAMLRKLMAKEQPAYCAAVFDTPGRTVRHEEYEGYKASRPETPADLLVQVPWVKRVCEALRVPVLQMEGYEADDVIGTLARRAADAGVKTIIVSEDKDLLQLVNDRVHLLSERMRRHIFTPDEVVKKHGVPPELIPDLLGLMGDAVDDIPGVPGIGPKRARELLQAYGSIEEAIAHADELIHYKYGRNLAEFADQARLSKSLATVHTDLDLPFDPDAFRIQQPDPTASRDVFSELDFRQLLEEFVEEPEPIGGKYELITSAAELEQVIASIRNAGKLSLALATDHSEPNRARIVGFGLSWQPGAGAYLPIGHEGLGANNVMTGKEAIAQLAPLLTDSSIQQIGHDVKFARIVLLRKGLAAAEKAPTENVLDTMVASYLLHPNRQNHELDKLSVEHLRARMVKLEQVLPNKKATLPEVPIKQATRYIVQQSDVALQLVCKLESELEAHALIHLYRELEAPLIAVLVDMELIGVRLDCRYLQEMSERLGADLDRLRVKIYSEAKGEFNLNSPKQLAEILFDRLSLPSGGRTAKTGSRSTRAEVLEALAKEHVIAAHILEYRELAKLKGTYVDALPELVHPETGRVHASFNQAVAATGRLSSSRPNLQNIPVRSRLGREIRRAFVPDDGHVLLTADYSQVELRILAHLSDDEALQRAFRSGEDIHRATAAEIFSVPPEAVSSEQRNRAKVINFGVLYGMGPQRLAREFGITLQEARDFIERYFSSYPGVRDYLESTIETALRDGFVSTMLGRRRALPELRSDRPMVRSAGERLAVNTPIQGTAADIIKLAMVRLHRRLQDEGLASRMLIQVHDELVLDVPAGELDVTQEIVRKEMESALELCVPLEVDVGFGANWMEAKA